MHKKEPSTSYHRMMRRRRYLLSSSIVILFFTTTHIIVHATTNFCGVDWGDASDNCVARQPCPESTNTECTTPGHQCWADTLCDTASGHGLAYDHTNPIHSRFCGSNWEDANNNCSTERHCPRGIDEECPKGMQCFLHLSSNCHYVDLLGGPAFAADAAISSSGGGGGKKKVDIDHPSRTNYCGWDWSSANKCLDDHWCPNGSDDDCPPGKTCFAGTECQYIDDLEPTITPTMMPTDAPSPSPVIYNTKENTSFCSTSWGDTTNTCRIGSNCPSGDDSVCPGEQKCFGWISGCNVLDFKQYFKDTGKEIFGAEHWLLPEGGLPGIEDVVVNDPSEPGYSGPGLPPAEIQSALGLTSPAIADETTATTSSSTEVSAPDHSMNEVPAPLPTPTDFSMNGVPSVLVTTPKPVTPPPTPQLIEPTTTKPTDKPISLSPTIYDPNRYVPDNHVFCGHSHADASKRCSPETFCAGGASVHQCDSPGDYCWAGVTACNAAQWNKVETSSPSDGSEDETAMPTPQWSTEPKAAPDKYVEIEEVAGSNNDSKEDVEYEMVRQSFCAVDYDELMSNCAILQTCNRWQPCPSGYSCFSNVKCLILTASSATDDSETEEEAAATPTSPAPTTPEPTFPPITMSPIAKPPMTIEPIKTNAPSISTPILTTKSPSSQPTKFTLSEDEIAQRYANFNNYCAISYSEATAYCSYALKTCNEDDLLCPMGTACFENIKCKDPNAVDQARTKAPVASDAPISVVPPPPTSKPSELMKQRTITPTIPPIATRTVTPTIPPIAATMQPTSKPIETPIPSARTDIPQDYCTTSVEELEKTCLTAQTCNVGDPLCPFGTFCMKSYLCSPSGDDIAASNAPVSTPTMKPVISNGSKKAQSYCAQYEEELDDMCSWTYTCNKGDPPCPTDTFCFTNYVCKSRPDEPGVKAESPTAKPAPPSTTVPDIDIMEDTVTTITTDSTDCTALCLQAIGSSDCEYFVKIGGIDIVQPCTGGASSSANDGGSSTAASRLCVGTGECGTDSDLNNCAGGHDVYFKLESSKCLEHGFAGGHGVIPRPESIKDEVYISSSGKDTSSAVDKAPSSDKDTASYDNLVVDWGSLNNTTASEVSKTENDNSTTNSDVDWNDWPTDEELEASMNDGGFDHGLAGWWLKTENHAVHATYGGIKNVAICFGISYILHFIL